MMLLLLLLSKNLSTILSTSFFCLICRIALIKLSNFSNEELHNFIKMEILRSQVYECAAEWKSLFRSMKFIVPESCSLIQNIQIIYSLLTHYNFMTPCKMSSLQTTANFGFNKLIEFIISQRYCARTSIHFPLNSSLAIDTLWSEFHYFDAKRSMYWIIRG